MSIAPVLYVYSFIKISHLFFLSCLCCWEDLALHFFVLLFVFKHNNSFRSYLFRSTIRKFVKCHSFMIKHSHRQRREERITHHTHKILIRVSKCPLFNERSRVWCVCLFTLVRRRIRICQIALLLLRLCVR